LSKCPQGYCFQFRYTDENLTWPIATCFASYIDSETSGTIAEVILSPAAMATFHASSPLSLEYIDLNGDKSTVH